mgnify:FL=1
MNILFCSVGRRAELLKDFRCSMEKNSVIIATDMSSYAPAIYFSDYYYIVPSIFDESYISIILEICRKHNVDVITTLIDPEIKLLAKNRDKFEKIGVEVLAPSESTADICFDKFKLFEHLRTKGIPTIPTYGCIEEVRAALDAGEITFPVFVKPREGSGSVGARRINNIGDLEAAFSSDPSLIAQKLMNGSDIDADIYVDTKSGLPVSAFSKRKLETKIGGASKTVSFKDDVLFDLLCKTVNTLEFNGPLDMDLFFVNGQYYVSEINPRFGGAYLHAYGAGIDFVKLIENNINGIENKAQFGDYEDNIVMMMYDSVVIKKIEK